jgi:hypothetical protein
MLQNFRVGVRKELQKIVTKQKEAELVGESGEKRKQAGEREATQSGREGGQTHLQT